MSTLPDIDTLAPHRPGFADEADIDLFVETLGQYERGEIDGNAWRGFRLLNGVYGQRQEGFQMVRVKIPLGICTAPQLRALADVAQRWSNGKGHLTTRQNVQFHFVDPANAEAVLRHVAAAGITTREACGNAVRTVTGSPWAGIHPAEPFDPTPYGEALVRHLLRGRWSSTLPRKFKIAIGGSTGSDDVLAAINDIGLVARVRDDGTRGFRFTVGGGLATFCRSGAVVEEFLPAAELLEAVEAVVRVFNRVGNRRNRNRARLRHAIHELGLDAFLELYRHERDVIRIEGGRPYALPPQPPVPVLPLGGAPEPAQAGYAEWALDSVKPQKQTGFSAVLIRLERGDITGEQLRALADIVESLPEPEARTTLDQNWLVRYVPQWRLPDVHRRLAEAGLARAGAGTILDITSCPGAASCKLAVTASRGLARSLGEFLAARPDVAARANDLRLKVSGCPNSCGHHHIADIGFHGLSRKVEGEAAPYYQLLLGGNVNPDTSQFGQRVTVLPARRVPEAVERLLAFYRGERNPNESFFG